MVAEILTTNGLAEEVILKLGSIGLWLRAIGIIFVLWVVFQVVNWAINRKRLKRLDEFEVKINRIEKKLDKVLKQK